MCFTKKNFFGTGPKKKPDYFFSPQNTPFLQKTGASPGRRARASGGGRRRAKIGRRLFFGPRASTKSGRSARGTGGAAGGGAGRGSKRRDRRPRPGRAHHKSQILSAGRAQTHRDHIAKIEPIPIAKCHLARILFEKYKFQTKILFEKYKFQTGILSEVFFVQKCVILTSLKSMSCYGSNRFQTAAVFEIFFFQKYFFLKIKNSKHGICLRLRERESTGCGSGPPWRPGSILAMWPRWVCARPAPESAINQCARPQEFCCGWKIGKTRNTKVKRIFSLLLVIR